MTDWARMERQVRMNKIATVAMVFCIFLQADEVYWAFKYHFPWWDDIMIPLTAGTWWSSWFVKKHTDMYRFDK